MKFLTVIAIIIITLGITSVIMITNENTATASGNTPSAEITLPLQNIIPEIKRTNSAGTQPMPANIKQIKITTLNSNTITTRWEIENGIGCCKTYNCNMTLFEDACLKEFKLFDIYLDDKKINMNNFEYNCEHTTPWNYVTIPDISSGTHTIKIDQKECTNTIVDTKSITFEMT